MHFAAKSNPTGHVSCNRCKPSQPAHFCQTITAKLNEYKLGLLEQFINESEAFLRIARLAVNEAESLAWSTPYAHWLLPALAEEKILHARQWASRQHRVGNGLAAVAISHEVIQWNEPFRTPQDPLATERLSRSSEVASRAFEAARCDTRP